ncbi:MAG TPA: cell division protein FtsA [bacterium]|nr:cell division protein FtsA [bacterium]
MGKKDNLIVGLDIGTTKACAIVAELADDGLDIVGIGTSPSYGLRRGVVVNIDATVESIRKAVEEAELMAGCEIATVFAGIAGGHIKGFNSHGIVAIKGREVSELDIKRVVEQARAVSIPMDREVIHILPQEFVVDDQDGIRDPLGMSGVRLEAKVHIVTGAITSAQNIVRCANRTGLSVADIVLEQLASSEAVLMTDEKEIGVALVDIGGGTTDIAVWHQGSIKHTAVLALGGDHVTNDVAAGLRTPAAEAERIKKKYGCASAKSVDKNETITVPSVGGRKPMEVPRQTLAEIIEPRMEEILGLVNRELVRAGFEDKCAAGVVLTGGAALLPGIEELGEQVFELPARVGRPIGIGGLIDVVNSPMYATGVGLVIYGSKNQCRKTFRVRDGNIFSRVFDRVREGVEAFF